MSSNQVPIERAIGQIEIKKSKFICWLDYCDSKEALKEMLAEARVVYPDARHHCWAYTARNGAEEGMHDDGEPKGTAGRPILTVLQHSDITSVSAIVIRYFGGTKLGTGGLARAYSDVVKEALKSVQTRVFEPVRNIQFILPFAAENQVRYLVDKYDCKIVITYSQHLDIKISVTNGVYNSFINDLRTSYNFVDIRILD